MVITNIPRDEIRFNHGDSLGDLALRVKEAYDKGERNIRVACQDFTFPDNVVLGGVWDSPVGPVQLGSIMLQALREVGRLPSGTLTAVPNPGYQSGQPYSMCLEYSLEK